MAVCVCARMCDTIREHLLFSSSLFLYCFTRSLSLSCTVQQPSIHSIMQRRCSATVRSSRQRTSVRVSVCLLVGTGADRKITTADRCSALGVFTLFNLRPHPHTRTHSTCVPSVCVLARSSIRRRSSQRYCGVVPILGSLASHAHYHGAATVLAAVFVCTCCVFYCPTRCNGFSCT